MKRDCGRRGLCIWVTTIRRLGRGWRLLPLSRGRGLLLIWLLILMLTWVLIGLAGVVVLLWWRTVALGLRLVLVLVALWNEVVLPAQLLGLVLQLVKERHA